jgi:integral membrane protein (TIGR01906 family)
MKDVRKLTRGTIIIRRTAYALAFGMLSLIIKMKTKVRTVFYSFMAVLGVTVVAVGMLVYVGLNNFKKAFYIFHELFFDNDLWLLDPDTDLMIRMLPEGFFLNMVIRIGKIFLLMMGILLLVSAILTIVNRNKKNL